MENIVQCKMCTKDFNYIPGPAGNARQLCDECRVIVDDKEVQEFMDKMIIEKNKYLVGAPGRKDVYDPSDILLNGNIPEFASDAEMFVCAIEFGKFVRHNGFGGNEANAAQLLNTISAAHRVLFFKQMSLQLCEHMCRDKNFKGMIAEIMRVAT